MFGISLQEFEALCHNRQRYTGYVEGLGYVFWKRKCVILGDNEVCSYKANGINSGEFYELVVIKDSENASKGLSPLENLKNTAVNAWSLYGIVNSVEQLSTKKVVIGPEYIQINPQGTLKRNLNREYTTKGKVASKLGWKIFKAGLVVDFGLFVIGEQTWSQTLVNMGVNTGIYMIGSICPPAGVALGIIWFICNISKRESRITPVAYETLHGSIAPPDATKVVTPYGKEILIKPIPYKNNYSSKQLYFEKGK